MLDRISKKKGMTYVELIVVLSIFSVISSVTLFNYRIFQQRVDIKNLANDIALKFVEAQKSSVSGKLPPTLQQPTSPSTWKPSYGVYINLSNGANTGNNLFYYFSDLSPATPDKKYDELFICPASECLEKISLTKGNYISELRVFYSDLILPTDAVINNAHITFTRPNSGASIKSIPDLVRPVDYLKITLATPSAGVNAVIKVYSSGRIDIE